MKPNIVACNEGGWTKPPPATLRQLGVERIVGRTIVEYCGILGSYGMGGPGFSGFRLGRSRPHPNEWLVLTLWAANNWLLLDERWVGAHPNQYHIQRPLIGFGDETWDEFTGKVVGAVIEAAHIHDDSTRLYLARPGAEHVLELPDDPTRLPVWGGSLEPHIWSPAESHWDAWVISRRGDLRC